MHRLDFLGFIIDSRKMKIFADGEKMKRVKNTARGLLREKFVTVRKLAKFLGMVTALAHASSLGDYNLGLPSLLRTTFLKSSKNGTPPSL